MADANVLHEGHEAVHRHEPPQGLPVPLPEPLLGRGVGLADPVQQRPGLARVGPHEAVEFPSVTLTVTNFKSRRARAS